MVITGHARGPNRAGEALEAIREAMSAEESAEEDPLTNVRMPKAQMEQAEQYFNQIRGDK